MLSEDSSIITKEADKEGAIIIMDRSRSLLGNGNVSTTG
jgi:hypothetical protein